jgi:hypothetical protein
MNIENSISDRSELQKEKLKKLNNDFLNVSTLLSYTIKLPLLGQFLRQFETATGGFLLPQFARHHFSNIFDGFAFASLIDSNQQSLQENLNKLKNEVKPIKSRPILCAAFALACGIGYEIHTSKLPNRQYDYIDTSLYAASSGVYAVLGTRRRKKYEAKVKEISNEP